MAAGSAASRSYQGGNASSGACPHMDRSAATSTPWRKVFHFSPGSLPLRREISVSASTWSFARRFTSVAMLVAMVCIAAAQCSTGR